MLDLLGFIFDLFNLIFFPPLVIRRRWELPKKWLGIVEEKKTQSAPTLSRYKHTVVFRTDDRKMKRLRMKKADFDRYLVGKTYQKKAGTYLPEPYLG